jgi:tetratricopeptide (TPR) repeat protein
MISNLRIEWLGIWSLILLGAVWTLQAQVIGGLNETTPTNLGGNNFISGTVFGPDGVPVNWRVPIRLQSFTKGDIIASTDSNGRFIFSRVPPGTYTFVIEADKDFERVSQDVEVVQARSSDPQSVNITIRLRSKRNPPPKPAVVDLDNVGVPKKALESYKNAVKLVGSNDIKGALEQLKAAIAEYPSFMNAFNEMGVLYMRLNELGKAAEALQEALKIDPKAFEPQVNYGIVLFRLKKFVEAEPVLRSALKVREEVPVVHFYLGRLLIDLERYEESEKELNLALTQSKDKMTEVHRMLAKLYVAKDDYKLAVEHLELYLQLTPAVADAEQLRQLILQLKGAKEQPSSPKQKPR